MHTTITTSTRVLAVSVILCALALLLPQGASAAAIVGEPKSITQEFAVVAESKNYQDGIAIFRISFSLTAFGADMYMPASADRAPKGTGLAYEILDGDKRTVTSGVSAAVLIAESGPSVDGMYAIPEGETRRFTLLAAFAVAPGANDEHLLRVSRLPLYNELNEVRADLTPSELEDLRTEFIAI